MDYRQNTGKLTPHKCSRCGNELAQCGCGTQRTIVPLADFHENADIELLEWKKWRERAEYAESEIEMLHKYIKWCYKIDFELEFNQWKAQKEGSSGE